MALKPEAPVEECTEQLGPTAHELSGLMTSVAAGDFNGDLFMMLT